MRLMMGVIVVSPILICHGIILIKVVYGVVSVLMQWIDVAFPCLVSARTVVSNHGETSLVSEGDKGSTAGGHALRVMTAESAITSVRISPHITVRLTDQVIKMTQLFLMNLLVLEQGVVPLGVLADGGGDTKLLILVDVDTLGTAGHI